MKTIKIERVRYYLRLRVKLEERFKDRTIEPVILRSVLDDVKSAEQLEMQIKNLKEVLDE